MMIAVVYESMFGNTRAIALAIAEGLAEVGDVMVGTVDELTPERAAAAKLIVVGGPTHNRGLAKPDARAALSAPRKRARLGEPLPGRESLRGWLERLPAGRSAVAAFDTRYDHARWIVGSAAREVGRALTAKGYTVAAVESFFVGSVGGPLADGELDRARAWGRALSAHARFTQAA